VLTSLFSLFYVTRECYRFLHRGKPKILLNCQLQNEASKANFDIVKRIYNWQPFMKVVYSSLAYITPWTVGARSF